MTTIAACSKNGKIVIGSDSLHSFGTLISNNNGLSAKKIYEVGGAYVGSFGSPAIRFHAQRFFRSRDLIDWGDESQIFDEFEAFFEYLVQDCNLNTQSEEDSEFLGWDYKFLIASPKGIYSIHELREVFYHGDFWAIGSGDEFCIGSMNSTYQNSNFSAEEVVKSGLESACLFDAYTQAPIIIHDASKDI